MSYVHNHITRSQTFSMKEIRDFLASNDLSLDEGVTDFIEVRFKGDIVACGGIDHNIIKCVAIRSCHRGTGVSLILMSQLFNLLNQQNIDHVFLFTKPENQALFAASGFYPLIQYADQVLLMENSAHRLNDYCKELAVFRHEGENIGSIVMNANPFTLGHHYLVKTAAAACDWLHVFLVREDRAQFRFTDRFFLVQQGIRDITNVTLHPGSDYIISRASFPNYFLKDKEIIENSYAAIDLKLFREYIAPALNIRKRFVGTEPLDRLTAAYNQEMHDILAIENMSAPAIEVIEIPRITINEQVISASRVRQALLDEDWSLIAKLVPQTTYDFLQQASSRDS